MLHVDEFHKRMPRRNWLIPLASLLLITHTAGLSRSDEQKDLAQASSPATDSSPPTETLAGVVFTEDGERGVAGV